MSSIGWELWGVKFDLLLIVLVTLCSFFMIRTGYESGRNAGRVDLMAGDEGED